MDITQAKLVLENTVKRVTDELAVLIMARDIINETFKPEFTSIENAQKEANDKVLEVNAEKQKVSELTTRAETAEAKIVEKEAEVTTFKKSLDDAPISPTYETLEITPE
jgi:ABC-type molybdate transport system ATPase subunit